MDLTVSPVPPFFPSTGQNDAINIPSTLACAVTPPTTPTRERLLRPYSKRKEFTVSTRSGSPLSLPSSLVLRAPPGTQSGCTISHGVIIDNNTNDEVDDFDAFLSSLWQSAFLCYPQKREDHILSIWALAAAKHHQKKVPLLLPLPPLLLP